MLLYCTKLYKNISRNADLLELKLEKNKKIGNDTNRFSKLYVLFGASKEITRVFNKVSTTK